MEAKPMGLRSTDLADLKSPALATGLFSSLVHIINLACLKHMLRKAVEWDYLKANPAKEIRFLKEPPGRLRYLTPKEAKALLKACSVHLRPIVVTALNTGMQKSEILRLNME
jgi:integrase